MNFTFYVNPDNNLEQVWYGFLNFWVAIAQFLTALLRLLFTPLIAAYNGQVWGWVVIILIIVAFRYTAKWRFKRFERKRMRSSSDTPNWFVRKWRKLTSD